MPEQEAVAALELLTVAMSSIVEHEGDIADLFAQIERVINAEIRYRVMASNRTMLGMASAFGAMGLIVAAQWRAEAQARLPEIIEQRVAFEKLLEGVSGDARRIARQRVGKERETGSTQEVFIRVQYANPRATSDKNGRVSRQIKERVKVWYCVICGKRWELPTFSARTPKYCPLTQDDLDADKGMSDCQRQGLYEKQHEYSVRQTLEAVSAQEQALRAERAKKEAERIAAGGKRRGRPRKW